MKNYQTNRNQQGFFGIRRWVTALTIATIGWGLLAAGSVASAPAEKPADSPIIGKCKADLAERLKVKAEDVKLIEAKATTWPDASLGMPETGKLYAQVVTPGWRIIPEAKGFRHLYTASEKAFRYGGPVDIWACSMFYIEPVENEPNLNGDLYQSSLLGTNSVLVASRVTDYYLQAKGMVITKRRMSRSSHELLYAKMDGSGKTRTLRSAFDFGAAAFNDAQDTWAGFVRPRLGASWNVTIASLGRKDADEQVLPLPEGFRPGQIAWSGDTIMIVVSKGEQTLCFEISPKADKPEWRKVDLFSFPGQRDFVLNKSQSLGIDQVTEDGKTAVEIAIVWFTGDHDLAARIDGLTMRGCDFLLGRYAVAWGEKDGKFVLYTVDIYKGDVIPCAGEVSRDVRPFEFPPISSPISFTPTDSEVSELDPRDSSELAETPKDHWAYEPMKLMYQLGILQGYPRRQ